MAEGWTLRTDGIWVMVCPTCGAYGETKVKPEMPICGCGQALDFQALRVLRNRPAS